MYGMGYLLLFLSGFYMGLLGSGGSILTLPLLLYVLHIEDSLAVPLSLGIVGISALFGVILKSFEDHVRWKKAILFSVFSMPAGFLGSQLGWKIGTHVQISIFLGLLLFVFVYMLLKKEQAPSSSSHFRSISTAILIGFLTGVVGVGGGFFLIPTFFYAEHLSYQDSAGTSLVVISLNSFSALWGYSSNIPLPYSNILIYGFLTSIGLLVGNHFSKKMDSHLLKKIFSSSLLIIFAITLYKNLT